MLHHKMCECMLVNTNKIKFKLKKVKQKIVLLLRVGGEGGGRGGGKVQSDIRTEVCNFVRFRFSSRNSFTLNVCRTWKPT